METGGHVERAILHRLSGGSVFCAVDRQVHVDVGQSGQALLLGDEVAHTNQLVRYIFRLTSDRSREASTRASVHRALSRLQEKDLVAPVDRDDIDDPEPRVKYWELTDAGRAEAERLGTAYLRELQTLRERFGGDWE